MYENTIQKYMNVCLFVSSTLSIRLTLCSQTVSCPAKSSVAVLAQNLTKISAILDLK